MDRRTLQELLAAVQGGSCSVDEALERLRHLPYEDLGFAKLDHHRGLRNGFPEVVLGEGKEAAQVVAIARRLHAAGGDVLVTRLAAEPARELIAALPEFRLRRDGPRRVASDT
jgi:NCAIR mutase (PurE)-related protein